MAGIKKKSFHRPVEAPEVPKGKAERVDLDGVQLWRMELEPGWSWAEMIGEESCPEAHPIFMAVSGRLEVLMDDGTAEELGPGDIGIIPAGHKIRVLGDEPFVAIDVQGIGQSEAARGQEHAPP